MLEENKQKHYAKLRESIIADNPILFKMAHRPMSETCMCWGLEFSDGWLDVFADKAAAMEGLNSVLYKLFRVRVQSDQAKSKYGYLHWYTSVQIDPNAAICLYESLVQKLMDKIGRIDFSLKKTVDYPQHVRTEKSEVKLEDLAAMQAHYKNCSNVKIEEHNGKWMKIAEYDVPEKCHYFPTKHKLLYKIYKHRYGIENFFRKFFFKPTRCQIAVACLAQLLQDKIVKDAEKECYRTCEHCGRQIGTKWSPRCETRGWITYLCDECASKLDAEYFKNGALWKGNECIKTKEEVDAQHKKTADNLKKDEDQT